MTTDLFAVHHGIIPACDVPGLDELDRLVADTCELPFISGYKVGIQLALGHGIRAVVAVVRKRTALPIVYDHQKFGTDIPEIIKQALGVLAGAGVQGVIVFPQAGPETLAAAVEGCFEEELTPLVGGDMTHRAYLAEDGGYITDDAPRRIYTAAASLGVRHFVVPGTRLAAASRYRAVLAGLVGDPVFVFPGIGRGQGGDIVAAFQSVSPSAAHAVVGRGIYAEPAAGEAARRLWSSVQADLL